MSGAAQDIGCILAEAVRRLSAVRGVEAVVLGGSRARGNAAPDSDVDIGVYYDGAHPPLNEALNEAATALDGAHREGLVVPYGGWGRWVDAGGWLERDGLHIDLILRDIRRVRAALSACEQGIVTAHYQTGHPHAYLNAMYAGEAAVCRILHDPGGALAELQKAARRYPEPMRTALISHFGFEAGFSHRLAGGSLSRGDPFYVAAHVTRAIACLNQMLFALNREYCLNEKKAVRMADGFALRPEGYARRVHAVIAQCGQDDNAATEALGALVADVMVLLPSGEA